MAQKHGNAGATKAFLPAAVPQHLGPCESRQHHNLRPDRVHHRLMMKHDKFGNLSRRANGVKSKAFSPKAFFPLVKTAIPRLPQAMHCHPGPFLGAALCMTLFGSTQAPG